MSALPQELYDIIISLCEPSALVSCSLSFSSPSSLPQVLLLVDGPVSTISPYVKSLVLKDWVQGSATSSSFYALLPRLAGRTVAVESLAFHSTDWEGMVHGALNFLVFYFKDTLKTLELRDCACSTFSSLVDLTSSFPALENLSLHRLLRLNPQRPEVKASPPPPLPRLRSVHAHGYIKHELFRWLMGLTIEVVTIGPLLPGESRAFVKFLRAMKNNLQHITLSGESTPNFHRDINLKNNQHLTSIHFTNLMLNYRGAEGPASMSWFISILLGMQSSSLRSLRFSVCAHSRGSGTLEVIDWAALRTCLDKPQFVCLTSVTFSFSMSRHKEVDRGWWAGYMEMAESFVRARLPQYLDTSILCFEFERVVTSGSDSDDESA
ncbi:hypothetical protein C8F04DRAFT_1355077 [Mycena alexandri]|uniref:Uncharacterized protein n=1 Tax=Mycena alexandri TaxID=1745969 RepID=A0AAD6SUX7_9AGAR|nr:hypothetical protein C8F04DRAFT_1355077 [Mycena alexandri]